VVDGVEPRAGMGSMINFVVVDDKVRFDIALQGPAKAESRLRIQRALGSGVARTLKRASLHDVRQLLKGSKLLVP